MKTRGDGRRPDELRAVKLSPHVLKHAEGSVMITMGDTEVLCAASVEERVPPFLEGKDQGWVTAEYAMLPRATHTRSKRDPGGRGKEIQRLIGRCLRAGVDMTKLGRRSITVDCDVIQADGGTRVASITGGYVALALALRRLGLDRALLEPVAAVSVGLVGGDPVLDLAYAEDSVADVDMNIVMIEGGRLVEVQGAAEQGTFDRKQLGLLLDLAETGIASLCNLQREALG